MTQELRERVADVATLRKLAATCSLWFDGSCEPTNPGGVATCGWVIRNDGDSLVASGHREACRGDGATNNVAEWTALGLALRFLLDNPIHVKDTVLKIYGDSKLVIEQLNGTWKCNAEHLQKLRDRCREILRELPLVTWKAEWIPREQNEQADTLSQLAYVEATGKPYPERRR